MHVISLIPKGSRLLIFAALLFAGATAAIAGKAPDVADQIVIYKRRKVMLLIRQGEVIKRYRVAIGRNPFGPKRQAGDCRTPEGCYLIDRRKKDSKFYKALHISYPNGRDMAAARKEGHGPGGEIMIHGLPPGFQDLSSVHYLRNWTKGCIAVNNQQMEEIWQLVPDGTPIDIRP